VKSDRNNRGFREMGDTVHKSGKVFARDRFDLGFPVAANDPEVLAGTPLYAPDQWPDLPGFEAAQTAYYTGCLEVGMKVLEGFALYLGQDAAFFTKHFQKPVADMVINHHFGLAEAVRVRAETIAAIQTRHLSHPHAFRVRHGSFILAQTLSVGGGDTASGAHTDHGIVTILWQDDSGGLEVMGADSEWLAAPPVRGSFVINIGELMKRWTNGRFKATVHRVIHRKDAARYSMPLFCNPDFRTMVDPRQLDVSDEDAQYAPVLSGDFLVSRFQSTRKRWGATQKPGAEVAIEMAAE